MKGNTAFFLPLLTGAFLTAAFCACTSSHRDEGALVGGAVGAGTGAIIGHQSGHGGEGAAIGGGAGVLVGGAIGSAQDAEEREPLKNEILRRQKLQLERQRQELEDIKRQQYHNQRLMGYE